MNRLFNSVVILQFCGCSVEKNNNKTWLPVNQNNCYLIASMFWLKRCLVTDCWVRLFSVRPTRGESAGRRDRISHLAQLRLLQKIGFRLFKLPTVTWHLKCLKCNKHNCHSAFHSDERMISSQPGEPSPLPQPTWSSMPRNLPMSNTWIIHVAAPIKERNRASTTVHFRASKVRRALQLLKKTYCCISQSKWGSFLFHFLTSFTRRVKCLFEMALYKENSSKATSEQMLNT